MAPTVLLVTVARSGSAPEPEKPTDEEVLEATLASQRNRAWLPALPRSPPAARAVLTPRPFPALPPRAALWLHCAKEDATALIGFALQEGKPLPADLVV